MKKTKKPDGIYIQYISVVRNQENYFRWACYIPFYLLSDSETISNFLLEERKLYIKEYEYWLNVKKNSDTIEEKKFAAAESKIWQQRYKAICFALPHFLFGEKLPGDCRYEKVNNWPIELAPSFDYIWHELMVYMEKK